jgi:hypothetical protein
MATTLTVVFDGESLRFEEPVDLEVNGRYEVVIGEKVTSEKGQDAWDILEEMKGSLRMPKDWSEETDHYLYGTPKRAREPEA